VLYAILQENDLGLKLETGIFLCVYS